MKKKPITLFLSAVSREFHQPDPADPHRFTSYREFLAESLRAIRQPHDIIMEDDVLRHIDPDAKPDHLGVVSQENLAQGFADLLKALEDEVREATAVIHLVGDMAGAVPTVAELRRLRERHPDLLRHEPELLAALGDEAGISYTQWELWFAFHHKAARLVFFATDAAPRSPAFIRDEKERASQQAHLACVEATGEFSMTFADQSDVTRQAVRALVRLGLIDDTAPAPPDPAALVAARELLEKIVPEIVASIRKPDPARVFLPDRAGVAVWIAALDTVAAVHHLDRRALTTLLDERLGHLLERAAASTEPTEYLELGFTLLALGEYSAALEAGERAASLAAEALASRADAEPAIAENRRDEALTALLLIHDIAQLMGRNQLAIEALEKGSEMYAQADDPLGWADYHFPLAQHYRLTGHYQKARNILEGAEGPTPEMDVPGIIDIYESEYGCPEPADEREPKLAYALVELAFLRARIGESHGTHTYARRARQIFERLGPEYASDVAHCLRRESGALLALSRQEGGTASAAQLLQGAKEAADKAVNIYSDLVRKDSGYRGNFAFALGDVGNILEAIGELQSPLGEFGKDEALAHALDCFSSALELWRNLVEEDPSCMDTRRRLSYSLNDVGGIHEQRGDYAEALRRYLESVEECRTLVRFSDDNVWYLEGFASALFRAARVLAKQEDTAGALRELIEAEKTCKIIVELDPLTPTYRDMLSRVTEAMTQIRQPACPS